MHSGIIKHRCVFRVLLCFEATVNSSTLFQTCLYHSRGTRTKWKGNWVDNLKTPLLPCSLLSPGFYISVHRDCSVTCPELHSRGKGKSLETSKFRIISTLPQRHGALSSERAKNVLSHCHVRVFVTSWTEDSPGRNTGVGCHALLWGIFPTQGSKPGLLHCMQMLYLLSH